MAQGRQRTRIILVTFAGTQLLDLTGPASVFDSACIQGTPAYRVVYGSVGGGPMRLAAGLVVQTEDLGRLRLRATDIIVVPGANEPAILAVLSDTQLISWLARAAERVRWVSSVCSGAFLLAQAGLLDGRKATTHWKAATVLAEMFPAVTVLADSIFLQDGPVWTSAGVTTGIDLALAMAQVDCGAQEVQRIAAELVLYVRRPGSQAQFSQALISQNSDSDELNRGLEWARAHLEDATVESLATQAGLSVRTLYRVCGERLQTTPSRLLQQLRLECSRTVLVTTDEPLKVVATTCGFGNAARMQRAFLREFGLGPREYRHLHRA